MADGSGLFAFLRFLIQCRVPRDVFRFGDVYGDRVRGHLKRRVSCSHIGFRRKPS